MQSIKKVIILKLIKGNRQEWCRDDLQEFVKNIVFCFYLSISWGGWSTVEHMEGVNAKLKEFEDKECSSYESSVRMKSEYEFNQEHKM